MGRPGCGAFLQVPVAIHEEMNVNKAVKTAEKFIAGCLSERGLVSKRPLFVDLRAKSLISPHRKKIFITPSGCYAQ